MFDCNQKILPALIYSKDSNLSLFNYPQDVQVRSFRQDSDTFFNNLIDEQLKKPDESNDEKKFISSAYLTPKFQLESYTESVLIIPGQPRNIFKTSIKLVRKFSFHQKSFIEISEKAEKAECNILWESSKTIEMEIPN